MLATSGAGNAVWTDFSVFVLNVKKFTCACSTDNFIFTQPVADVDISMGAPLVGGSFSNH